MCAAHGIQKGFPLEWNLVARHVPYNLDNFGPQVNNTDAEGRLTLADALWYAQEHAKVESVIDIATLTGAALALSGQNIGNSYPA